MSRIMTAVMIFALVPSAYAQKKTAPARKPAAHKAAPAADQAKAVLEKLEAWDASLKTLKAAFTQEVDFTEAGLKQSIEGNLSYVRPNLLRIEHVKPARQLVVTDKDVIWIYKPGDRQAVRTKWDVWRRTQDRNFSGILDFGDYSALTRRNSAKVEGGKDGAPYTVTFTPRSGSHYTLTLTLSATDYFPVAAQLSVDGTVIKTTLSDVQKNTEVDRGIFDFVPPKGTEILEFKN